MSAAGYRAVYEGDGMWCVYVTGMNGSEMRLEKYLFDNETDAKVQAYNLTKLNNMSDREKRKLLRKQWKEKKNERF